MKKVLFTATVDVHILSFHIPYLKYFKDQGYEVHVATNGNAEIPYCDKKHIIPFERSPYKINNLRAIGQLKKIVDHEKYDIIHTHTPMGSVVTRLASIKARKKGTRVIYTAHGFHFYKGAPVQNWIMFYPIEKILSRYTDTLITINKEDFKLASKNFKKAEVKYIPGVGVDPSKFNFEMTNKEKSKLRNSLGLKESDFVIIYAAELNKNKNQIMAINAMKELVKVDSNIHLLLAGNGILKEHYESKIAEYKLQDNVHLLGYRNDIPKLLKISDLAVSTSLREGLGLNVIEALINDLPVIATNNRGHRDLIEDGTNGYLINCNDSKHLVDLILFNRNNKLNTLAETQKFLIENAMEKMRGVYER